MFEPGKYPELNGVYRSIDDYAAEDMEILRAVIDEEVSQGALEFPYGMDRGKTVSLETAKLLAWELGGDDYGGELIDACDKSLNFSRLIGKLLLPSQFTIDLKKYLETESLCVDFGDRMRNDAEAYFYRNTKIAELTGRHLWAINPGIKYASEVLTTIGINCILMDRCVEQHAALQAEAARNYEIKQLEAAWNLE